MRWALTALAMAGCSFSGANVDPNRDGEPPETPDAGNQCPWTYVPRHEPAPCELPAGEVVDLATPNTIIDTDSSGELDVVTNADGVEVARWVVASLTVGGSLRVTGSRPLLIVSQSSITIDGALDLVGDLADSGDQPAGAGDATICIMGTGQNGSDDSGGAAGGGGGAFGSAGADGENGDDDGDGSDGGAGGQIEAGQSGVGFRGGCNGGSGGDGQGNSGGAAGSGGGAIHLTARDQIVINGMINAGGGGGAAGDNRSDGGGGGGGSGGYVGLEANSVTIDASAFIAANGGGGGGGTSTSDDGEGPGQAGLDSAMVAAGGPGARSNGGDGGGDGGAGAALGAQAQTPTSQPVGGAGGGGGGVGVIVVGSAEGAPSQAQFSPAYSSLPLTGL